MDRILGSQKEIHVANNLPKLENIKKCFLFIHKQLL